jgi:NadR type nicotinamide-nucleotide adenylyltransferase
MIRRIVVTGSECTGKTTLAKQLGEALHAPVALEFSRRYAESVGRPLTVDDVAPIARGHVACDEAVLAQAHRTHAAEAVLDTDLVSTCVYAELYYGACPAWISEEALRLRGDLYLLAQPDVPWLGDGVRDRPAQRAESHAAFVAWLSRLGCRTVAVSGLGPARLANALAAVRGWRAATAELARVGGSG